MPSIPRYVVLERFIDHGPEGDNWKICGIIDPKNPPASPLTAAGPWWKRMAATIVNGIRGRLNMGK